MPNLVNDFEVRKETLRALGGNPDGLANIYEVDKEILRIIQQGGGGGEGIPDAPVDGVQYGRQNGEWTPVESGIDWNTIKQKLAEDGVESIKFIIGDEQVILTASEVKNLLNQTVLPDAPSDSKTYGRNNGAWTPVESGYPIKQGVQIDNNVVSVENYGIYTKLNGNFISYESGTGDNYVRLYDKLEVLKDGEKSEANFIDVANAGNGVVKTSNGGKVKFWSGTQAEYDAITTKDANTLYIIK